MTVDFLIDWFSTIGDFPVIAFIIPQVFTAYTVQSVLDRLNQPIQILLVNENESTN